MPRFSSRDEYQAWKASQQGEAASSPAAVSQVSPSRMAPVLSAAKTRPKQGLKEAFSNLPAWAWPFIVGCLAVPLVSLGGAVPGALGFGGAAGCANVAKKEGWSVTTRVIVSAAITGGVWLLFLAFAVAIAAWKQ